MISTPQARKELFILYFALSQNDLTIKVEAAQIKDIRCWPNVILVVGQRSEQVCQLRICHRFGVNTTHQILWRKRWEEAL